MPQHYTGRVAAILIVLLVSLFAIFAPSISAPLEVGLNPNVPWSSKLNLKPGIDIVGGTSLLYEIKQPEGMDYTPELADKVTTALKQRVDPSGVRNLIWRPQNPNRLEIQMPLTTASGESAKRQAALEEARARLEATNAKPADVIAAVETKTGDARAAALAELAGNDPARKQVVNELAAAFDAIQKAKAANDIDAGAVAEVRYEKLKADLAATNLTAAKVDDVLNLKASKQARLDELKQSVANSPERKAAVDAYIAAKNAVAKGGGELESAADLKKLLSGAGVLEFHILPEPSDPDLGAGGIEAWVQRLQTDGPRVKAGDKYRWFEVERPDEFKGQGAVLHNDRHWVLGSIKPEDSLDRSAGQWALAHAHVDQDNTGLPAVGFNFDAMGGKYFGDLTTKHVGKRMAIMLDGRVISAPNINSPITGGRGIITGGQKGFTQTETTYLVRMLGAGSLPAQLDEDPISERTVGPQLGEDNLHRGLFACVLGLVVVFIFLVGYYHLSGLVAFAAVLLNVIIILGAMAVIKATFTLPGIAAMVLTVGTAVDSNVLIFERLREEQLRGVSIRMALRNAYDRAFSAIFDSNMTTLITSLFLILFGTEEVKGFGITLIVGILASLFTSLYVTKTIFGLLVDRGGVTRLGSLPMSYPRWDRALRPNINWMRLAWPFIAFSVVTIAVGTVLFARYLKAGQMFDIEFASGTAVTFELKQPEQQETVREWIAAESRRDPEALPAAAGVVRVGNDGTTWEVTAPSANGAAVRDAVVRAVGTNLKAELPSEFRGFNQPLDAAATAGAILPLTPENLAARDKWPNNFIPEQAKKYPGGAALLLRDLKPMLSANEITARLKRQTLQLRDASANAGQVAAPQDFEVVAYGGPDKPVDAAVVLAHDPLLPYAQDPDKWKAGVAGPMWTLASDAVSQPAKLQQVKNFDPSVAGDTQRDALIALSLSILFIVMYIWFRFGNLRYGAATVVALIHDVLFTLAALGFAHALSGTFFGEALQLEPFRINLTIVAGILTVMGFSMLDTIVVFDRVRELRGKYGHLSAGVINDAINQTLSRTLLTASTTVVSITIMYFIGGPGIHGFTFVLLIGILVGTYSSIAVASPFLLLGSERTDEATAGIGRLQRAGA